MIIDTSALLAILGDEPEREIFVERIIKATYRGLSTVGFVETSIVMDETIKERVDRMWSDLGL